MKSKIHPNLAGLWVTEWSDEELLRPIIEEFKRYSPIPVSAEAESLLDKISRLSGVFAEKDWLIAVVIITAKSCLVNGAIFIYSTDCMADRNKGHAIKVT